MGFTPVEWYTRNWTKITETMYPYLVIDDLRVYQRKLTDYEPMQMFKYNVYSSPANLYMHYAFDEGQGAVFHDSVGHFDVPLYPNGNTPMWRADQPNCLSTATQDVILPVTAIRLGNNMTVTLQALNQFGIPHPQHWRRRPSAAKCQHRAASSACFPLSSIVTFAMLSLVQIKKSLCPTPQIKVKSKCRWVKSHEIEFERTYRETTYGSILCIHTTSACDLRMMPQASCS